MGGSFVHTLAISYDLSLGLVSKPSFKLPVFFFLAAKDGT